MKIEISFDNEIFTEVRPNGISSIIISNEKQEGFVFYRKSLKADLVYILSIVF